MRMNSKRRIGALMPGLLLTASISAAQSFSFAAVDVPCSACPGGVALQTSVNGINAAGDVVGSYVDDRGVQRGFLLHDGRFTLIDFPGAVSTSANGIGPSGEIVGNYTAPVSAGTPTSPAYCPGATSAACIKGFAYRGGAFSTVLFPGHPGAIAQRITPRGDIYGCLHDMDMMMSMFGAAWTPSGDVSLAAGGGELADPQEAVPISMNNGATPDERTIVGLWTDTARHRHGFVVRDGVFQTYDVPESILTAIWDIDPAENFVGTYVDASGRRHGFVQRAGQSSPVVIDYPGAASTIVFGINPAGDIVGQYSLNGHLHGFVAVPVSEE